MSWVTRFAPSPTGPLHLGHAFAALFAREKAEGGRFLLRLEDIDLGRSRKEYEDGILEDLKWLGLEWELPVRRQSEHFEEYRGALGRLGEMGLLYPCFCTRKEIQLEVARSGQAPHGPEGPLYPGICRRLRSDEVAERMALGRDYALRLDVEKVMKQVGEDLVWTDVEKGSQRADARGLGDVVLARKETPTSYHLAVVVDDAAQGITRVTRGEDLLFATPLHRVLQELLGLPVPEWWHHRLISDENGRRLAKRDNSKTLQALRDGGCCALKVSELLGIS
ncbi:tRNA glutamyl-Q(34) synthetase GluQRS [Phragmitibacter flavus]|uniref:tRNA glutamyl-Q(34) synthetase GluQRS n=1 Tax=Phragmitibacter flavus TaxID=2576071 RepID=A0A5R8KG78_9BACT|nr:tRNA glutamyl-Q(34) synthetase GluQRS [Phragmitibacter flavus]TLD71241.1 tRNA glutamyl-Q(34) synthetase GluQRS [Phragmitibacter flavus]